MLVGIDTTLGQPAAAEFWDSGGTDLTGPEPGLGLAHPDLVGALGDDAAEPERAGPHRAGLLDLMGLAGLPLTVWLAFLCGAFAAAGLTLQAVARGLSGAALPSLLAAPLALAVAVPVTRAASRTIRRLLPRETSSAISERSFGNRVGRVVVGTARRGSPAQVRFTDGHGNTHYAMAEPLDEAQEIAAGTEVAILRTRDGALRLVRTG